MTFEFNSKASYLSYRAAWKLWYLECCAQIRKSKLDIRAANSAYSKGTIILTDIWEPYYAVRAARKAATEMLLELTAAKREAGRQMNLEPKNSSSS